MTKKVIYFLCTRNSARSQIAEGLAKTYLSDDYEVHSAGIEVSSVHPIAIQVMKDIDIDISEQTSKLINLKLYQAADIVVTLCKDAYERCPNVPPRTKHLHWGIDDPNMAEGTETEILQAFVNTRNEIEQLIKEFAEKGLAGTTTFIDKEETFYPQKENFGDILQSIREEHSMTQEELAERLKVNVNFIKRAEEDKAIPSKFFVHHLASLIEEDYETVLNRLYEVK